MTITDFILSLQPAIKLLSISIFFLIIIIVLNFFKKKNPQSKNWAINSEIATRYLLSVFIVSFSAWAGPAIFKYILNYTIDSAATISASDATNYTLTAFLAIVIASLLNK
jgi:hypothetical protein